MNERRFAPTGPLALDPKAFGFLLIAPYQPVAFVRDGVMVIGVRGPMSQFRDAFSESYESLVERVEAAVASRPPALVLSIASPGGVVAGCFEAARRIRSVCTAAGVPLFAYVDGNGCSAAYAIACAADRIVASSTSSVGSVGTIGEVRDTSAANALQGVKSSLLTSGGRKADGVPDRDPGHAWASLQAQVDKLADQFFAWVSERRGISVDAVRALEAATFIGADAQSMGLTDATQTLDELVSSITTPAPANGASKETDMGTKATASGAGAGAGAKAEDDDKSKDKDKDNPFSSARSALQAIVDDEKSDDKAKAKAKAALAAMDDEPEAEAEADAPAPEKKDDDGKKDDDTKALAARLASLESRETERVTKAEVDERAALLATRPDLDEPTKKILGVAPLAEVRSFVKDAPKRAFKPAATAGVIGARGAGQGDPETAVSEETAEMDRRMGISDGLTTGVRREGNRVTFGLHAKT